MGSPFASRSPAMCDASSRRLSLRRQIVQGARVGAEHAPAKDRLMQLYPGLANGVVPCNRTLEWRRDSLVERADHLAGRDEHAPFRRVVRDHVGRVERSIPTGTRGDEVDEWDVQDERLA